MMSCPVSRQAQPGKIESDQAVALQCPANFGLSDNLRHALFLQSPTCADPADHQACITTRSAASPFNQIPFEPKSPWSE